MIMPAATPIVRSNTTVKPNAVTITPKSLRGPRDRARRRNSADQRRKNIRDPLPDQFLVWIVPRLCHAVGDHRGKKRFDGAERGDGKGRRHQLSHRIERNDRKVPARPAARELAESAADGRDRPAREMRQQRGGNNSNDTRRHAFDQARPQINDRQRDRACCHRIPIEIAEMQGQGFDLLRRVLRHLEAEPEKLVQLPAKNDHSNAAGEPGHDRIGKEFQEPPHLERSDRDEHHARHHRGERQTAVAMLRDDREQHRNKRTGGPRDLKARSAEKSDRETGHDSSPQSLLWRHARRDGEPNREWQRNNSDCNPGQEIRGKICALIVVECGENRRPKRTHCHGR